MLLKVIKSEYRDGFKLELSFNDGTKGVVDLKEKVFNDHRSIFMQLQDVEYFKRFKRNRWTVEWENGVDLAPEFLHELITSDKEKAHNLTKA